MFLLVIYRYFASMKFRFGAKESHMIKQKFWFTFNLTK